MSDNILWRYTGQNGAFLLNVPTRDLTEDEYNALPPAQRIQVRQSGIYEKVLPPAPEPKRKAKRGRAWKWAEQVEDDGSNEETAAVDVEESPDEAAGANDETGELDDVQGVDHG